MVLPDFGIFLNREDHHLCWAMAQQFNLLLKLHVPSFVNLL